MMRVLCGFAALLLLAGIAWLGPRGYAAAKLGWVFWREGAPDDLYRIGERCYMAGDYEKAELACVKALRGDPSHAPAKALLMEVQYIQGRGTFAAQVDPGRSFICQWGVPSQQTLVEIDTAFVRADRALAEGDPDAAEKELRKILEYAKWVPEGIEILRRRERARAKLECVQAAR